MKTTFCTTIATVALLWASGASASQSFTVAEVRAAIRSSALAAPLKQYAGEIATGAVKQYRTKSACCSGVMRMHASNLAMRGYSREDYAGLSLKEQVAVWADDMNWRTEIHLSRVNPRASE